MFSVFTNFFYLNSIFFFSFIFVFSFFLLLPTLCNYRLLLPNLITATTKPSNPNTGHLIQSHLGAFSLEQPQRPQTQIKYGWIHNSNNQKARKPPPSWNPNQHLKPTLLRFHSLRFPDPSWLRRQPWQQNPMDRFSNELASRSFFFSNLVHSIATATDSGSAHVALTTSKLYHSLPSSPLRSLVQAFVLVPHFFPMIGCECGVPIKVELGSRWGFKMWGRIEGAREERWWAGRPAVF